MRVARGGPLRCILRQGVLVGLVALCWLRPSARAAGLVLAPPGVGALGQAGAVVATTDDPLALVYNPGGLAFAANQVLLDGALPYFVSRYTRRITADGPDLPTVSGRPVAWAIPNAGVVWALPVQFRPRLAALLTSDYPLVQAWPDARHTPNTPQRYATGGFGGTTLARIIVGAALAPKPWLSVGASAQLLTGSLRTVSTLSACEGIVCHQPENPAYDATAALRSGYFMVPGYGAGAVARVGQRIGVGLSYSSGFAIHRATSLDVQLPTAPLYRGATMNPSVPTAQLQLNLPGVWRLGVAVALPRSVQVEVALAYTRWHVHRTLDVQRIRGAIDNLLAVGSYRLTSIAVPRNLQDTLSFHLAARRAFVWGRHTLQLRGGVMLEPSAAPNAMLTAMAVDLPKGLASMSAAWRYKRAQLTLSYGIMVMGTRRVSHSAVTQINPTQPAGSSQLTAVGNGLYEGSAHIAGAAVQLFF